MHSLAGGFPEHALYTGRLACLDKSGTKSDRRVGVSPGRSGSALFSSLFGPTAPAVRPARRRRTDGPARPGHPRPDRRAANGRSVGDRGVLRWDEPAVSPRPGSGTDSRTPGPIPGPPRSGWPATRPALAGAGWSVAGGAPATGRGLDRPERDGRRPVPPGRARPGSPRKRTGGTAEARSHGGRRSVRIGRPADRREDPRCSRDELRPCFSPIGGK